MFENTIKSVLLIVVAFLLRYVLQLLHLEIPEDQFTLIVAGIVGWLMLQFGYAGVRAGVNRYRPNTLK